MNDTTNSGAAATQATSGEAQGLAKQFGYPATAPAPAAPTATSVAGACGERALFEAWAKKQGHDVVSRLGTGGKVYVSSFTRHAWVIWQARAALAAAPAAKAEPFAPHILEALSWHGRERDDLTLEDAVKAFRFVYKEVRQRDDRAMLAQIIHLMASAPAPQADDVRDALHKALGLCDNLIHTSGRDARALACELRPKLNGVLLRTTSAAPADEATDCKCQQGQCCIVCDPDVPWKPADKEGK